MEEIIHYAQNFKLTGNCKDPSLVDYNLFGFHKKRTIVDGELTVIDYYRTYDGATYSDLVVKETRAYNRDVNRFPVTRDLSIDFYYEDGTVGLTKSTVKYYNLSEKISECLERRNNVLNDAKQYILVSLGEDDGLDLLKSVQTEYELFKEGKIEELSTAINDSTKLYLTAEIKAGIISSLTYF